MAGEYKLNYGIVDNVTGEDAVNSGLLGKDVDLKAWVVNEKGEQSEIKKDGNGQQEDKEAKASFYL